MNEQDRNRVQILYVKEQYILEILNRFDGASSVEVPVFYDMPEDVQVVRAFYVAERQAVGLLVRHPSFEVVPPGLLPPELRTSIIFRELDIPGAFRRAKWFVDHVQDHLAPDEKVVCKICDRELDDIANEAEAPAATGRGQ